MPSTSKPLNEGMWAGDLEDLVLPLITIDEYASELAEPSDPEAPITVGFYVKDRDAGLDLSRFLQKSDAEYYDTDLSPAPDQEGYYRVFVEVPYDDNAGDTIEGLLKEISPLVSIKNWRMYVHNHNLMDFAADKVAELVKAGRQIDMKRQQELKAKAEQEKQQTEVLEYLVPSALSNATLRGTRLVVETRTSERRFVVEALALAEEVETDGAVRLDSRSLAECEHLRRMLGEGWIVMKINENFYVQHEDDERVLVLRD